MRIILISLSIYKYIETINGKLFQLTENGNHEVYFLSFFATFYLQYFYDNSKENSLFV